MRTTPWRRGLLALLLAAGCGGGGPADPQQQPDEPADVGPGKRKPDPIPPRPPGVLPEVQKSLPTFEIEVDPAELKKLMDDPGSDTLIPAMIALDGERAPGTFGLRGASSRYVPQKGFKLELDKGYDLDSRDHFQLIAEYADAGKMAEKLATDLFVATGALASETRFVLVTLNGKPNGLYLDMEHVGKDFLKRHGLEPDATVYRCGGRNCELKSGPDGNYQSGFTRRTNELLPTDDMAALLQLINRTDDPEFERQLEERVDVEGYLGNLVVDALNSSIVIEDMRGFWIHELAKDRWVYAPWDLNNSFMLFWRDWDVTDPPKVKRELAAFSLYDPDVASLHAERVPSAPSYLPTWSVLNTRLWDRPALRNRLLDKLEWALAGPFSPEKLDPHVDALWSLMGPELLRDPFVAASHAPKAVEKIRTYADGRRAFLQQQIPLMRNHGNGPLVINEIGIGAPGQAGYVELHNRGPTPLPLGGLTITNDLRRPMLHRLPASLSIPPNGFVRLNADGGSGPDSLPFTLGADGGELGVFDGQQVVAPFDALFYGPHAAGSAYGRFPDGSEDFRAMTPTAGQPNSGQ